MHLKVNFKESFEESVFFLARGRKDPQLEIINADIYWGFYLLGTVLSNLQMFTLGSHSNSMMSLLKHQELRGLSQGLALGKWQSRDSLQAVSCWIHLNHHTGCFQRFQWVPTLLLQWSCALRLSSTCTGLDFSFLKVGGNINCFLHRMTLKIKRKCWT